MQMGTSPQGSLDPAGTEALALPSRGFLGREEETDRCLTVCPLTFSATYLTALTWLEKQLKRGRPGGKGVFACLWT